MTQPAGIFCQHADVELRGDSNGPLAGLSFAVKDVFAIAGVRACYGNPAWLETHAPAPETAPVVRSLLAAGANMIGLTLTDELALSLTGVNAHYGTPPNPRAPSRVPGGSSCGSAAAVACGSADFALGTDTGGSVRVPASHTGLFGIRPSHAAIGMEGVLPLAPRFDTIGWFARDAGLLERIGAQLLPPSAATAKPTRLRLLSAAERFMEPKAWSDFLQGARALALALDRPLEPVELDAPLDGAQLEVYLSLQNAELIAHHRAFIEQHSNRFGSLIRRRMGWALGGGPLPLPAAEALRERLAVALTRALDDAWLLLPSAPGAAQRRDASDDEIEAYSARGLCLTTPASLVGLPQVSLPLAISDGCPLGVSLLGPSGSDRSLLAAIRGISPLTEI